MSLVSPSQPNFVHNLGTFVIINLGEIEHHTGMICKTSVQRDDRNEL